jgi:hypothetical protein
VSRQDQHVDIRLVILDPAEDGSAIETGHTQIGNDAVEWRCGEMIDALQAACDGADLAAFLAERLFHRQPDEGFIVDDKNSHHTAASGNAR